MVVELEEAVDVEVQELHHHAEVTPESEALAQPDHAVAVRVAGRARGQELDEAELLLTRDVLVALVLDDFNRHLSLVLVIERTNHLAERPRPQLLADLVAVCDVVPGEQAVVVLLVVERRHGRVLRNLQFVPRVTPDEVDCLGSPSHWVLHFKTLVGGQVRHPKRDLPTGRGASSGHRGWGSRCRACAGSGRACTLAP